MNELEEILNNGSDDAIDTYLSNVTAEDFRQHVKELRNQSSDVNELKKSLLKFLQNY